MYKVVNNLGFISLIIILFYCFGGDELFKNLIGLIAAKAVFALCGALFVVSILMSYTSKEAK